MKKIAILLTSIVMLSYCTKQEELKCEKPQSSELKDLKKTLKVSVLSWMGDEDYLCRIILNLEDTTLFSNNIEYVRLAPFNLPDSIVAISEYGNAIFEAELLFTGNDFECISGDVDPKPGTVLSNEIYPEVRVLSIVPL